jgi:hypothetical protein
MRPQRFADDRTTALPSLDVWSFHRRDRRPQAKLAKGAKHLHIINEALLAQRVPGYLARGILPDQFIPLGLGHGHLSEMTG